MKLKSIHISLYLIACIACAITGCDKAESQKHFSEVTKVALRDIGNKLLIINNDSTSLILPVTKLDENRYEITFENSLEILPDSLVKTIGNILKNANLPKRYIVEVFNCENGEVSYSFKITGLEEQNIVPCSGRNLPSDCYKIQVLFLENQSFFGANKYYALTGFIIIVLIILGFILKNKVPKNVPTMESACSKIGAYRFYKEQNKLIKDSVEINLSVKECELMAILSANQNKVVKREILVKEIWEDRGVFVDRSLDTFISKLRKKFKDDPTINIVNIHGVGYKLEVN